MVESIRHRRNRRRIVDLCLLRARVLDYGQIRRVRQILLSNQQARGNTWPRPSFRIGQENLTEPGGHLDVQERTKMNSLVTLMR